MLWILVHSSILGGSDYLKRFWNLRNAADREPETPAWMKHTGKGREGNRPSWMK